MSARPIGREAQRGRSGDVRPRPEGSGDPWAHVTDDGYIPYAPRETSRNSGECLRTLGPVLVTKGRHAATHRRRTPFRRPPVTTHSMLRRAVAGVALTAAAIAGTGFAASAASAAPSAPDSGDRHGRRAASTPSPAASRQSTPAQPDRPPPWRPRPTRRSSPRSAAWVAKGGEKQLTTLGTDFGALEKAANATDMTSMGTGCVRLRKDVAVGSGVRPDPRRIRANRLGRRPRRLCAWCDRLCRRHRFRERGYDHAGRQRDHGRQRQPRQGHGAAERHRRSVIGRTAPAPAEPRMRRWPPSPRPALAAERTVTSAERRQPIWR